MVADALTKSLPDPALKPPPRSSDVYYFLVDTPLAK
jgi:hypothetical protein